MQEKKIISFSPPDISEEEINEVCDTLKSGWITTGPKVKKLESDLANYLGTSKVVCLNSATAAMEMVLRVLGVGPGDEVIVPAYTYTASCSIIYHVGATPVMVDVEKDTYHFDYIALEKAITNKTKVIIPVDLAGVICDYDKIFEIVEKKKDLFHASTPMQEKFNRVIVLADAAHALGAKKGNLMCGNIADFTCFSFHAVKNFTTAEGGAITWKDQNGIDAQDLYKQFQIYSLHGQTKDALSKSQVGSWEYDILLPGYKCNMTDIMASLGLVQLKRYPELLDKRYSIVKKYNEGFQSLNVDFLKHFEGDMISSCHLYLIRVLGINESQRNEIIKKLADVGISSNVHYKPLPMLSAYIDKGFDIKVYPNAYNQYKNVITLPLYSTLKDEEVEYIIQEFRSIVQCY